MEQQRALNALEPYVALCKSAAAPRAAAEVIARATSDAHTFVFAELLHQPQIQSLRGGDYTSHLALLEIFAWGTWGDYQEQAAHLPPLTEPQQDKLRLLSLLTLLSRPATATHDPLAYATLQTALALPSTLALERLIQTAIYSSLITGHLDQLHARVAVTAVAPLRDLAPNALPHLTRTLHVWEARCAGVLAEIDAEVARVKREARETAERDARRSRLFEEAVAQAELKWGNHEGEGEGADASRGKKRGFPGVGRKVAGRA